MRKNPAHLEDIRQEVIRILYLQRRLIFKLTDFDEGLGTIFYLFILESTLYYVWYYLKLQHQICFPGLLEVLVLSVANQVSVATSITFMCCSLSYHACYLVCSSRKSSFLVIFWTLCHILCSTMGAPHCLVTALFSTGNQRDLHFLARGHQSYHLHYLPGLKFSTYLSWING